MWKTVAAGLSALVVVAGAQGAQAAAYGFDFAPTSYDGQLHLGLVFTPNVDINVTALAYFDLDGDGFQTEHQVGIFQGDTLGGGGGALVAFTTLAAGASGVLGANDFRYQAITPVRLYAGQRYTIAGTSPGAGAGDNDAWVFGGPVGNGNFPPYQGFSVDPRLTIGPNAARYVYGGGANLIQPTEHYSDYQFYAVNFDFVGVPEPGTWALMIGGFGLAGAILRRRRAAA